MYTYFLVILLSVLVTVFASNGDRKWLLKMMLGLPEDDRPVSSNYNPKWTPLDEDRSLSEARKWPLEETSDRRNSEDMFLRQGLISDFKSEPNVEKKWPNHAKFHFSGFICCNQPPTPHPKTKRLRRPNDESLRSIVLKEIAKSLARDRLTDKSEFLINDGVNEDKSGSLGLGDINYADVDPRFLPMMEDTNDRGYPDAANQLYPNIQRRGVSVHAKRDLPDYEPRVPSHGRYGIQFLEPTQQHHSSTPVILIYKTMTDVEPVDQSHNIDWPRQGNALKDIFRRTHGGRHSTRSSGFYSKP